MNLRLLTFLASAGVLVGASRVLSLGEVPNNPATTQSRLPNLIRLSSNEFIGLMTISRYEEKGDGSIDVALSTGSSLNFANASDVMLVKNGLASLDAEGRAQLFKPTTTMAINLAQITNVWNNDQGFTFWGVDGRAWSVPAIADKREVWTRLCEIANGKSANNSLLQVTPSLVVNLDHVGHVSMVDGKLRFFMSNKTWPIIESAVDIESAKSILEKFARHE